jgi:uncharacterized protein (DUF1800 family)
MSDGAATVSCQHGGAVSRRAAVQRGAWRGLGAVVGALAGTAAAAGRVAGAPPEVAADVDPGALMHTLVNRITFGFTQAELADANALGYDGYLERQLDHLNIPEDPALVARVSALATMSYTGEQLYDTTLVNNSATIVNDLTEATIVRAIYSKRQLFERMVEFWSDHFNIDITQEEGRYLKTLDDRAVRQYALTTFGQLLNASARSPAMAQYLDNELSSNGSINENYAREVMELHTVGAEYLYSFPQAEVQATIVAVARALTGWGRYKGTFNDTTPGGTGTSLRGTFFYNSGTLRNQVRIGTTTLSGVAAGVHDTGSKTLGTIFGAAVLPAGRSGAAGQQDGQDVLDMLAAHPATAAYIARKLCRRFLGEGVSQRTIDSVRDAYLNPGNAQGVGDIKAMLRVMLRPSNVANAFPRFKRPFHLFASAMRAVPTTITSTSTLRTRLTSAGHTQFAWTSPDGYPDTTDYWTGQVLPRWSFCASLATNTSGNATGISGVTVDDVAFFSGATTPAAVMDKLNQALFGGLMPVGDKALIQATLSATPTATQKRDAIGLALASPMFQWY